MNTTISQVLPAPAGLMIHYYTNPMVTNDTADAGGEGEPTSREPAGCLALVEWTDDTGTTRQQIEVMKLNPDGSMTKAMDNQNVAYIEFE